MRKIKRFFKLVILILVIIAVIFVSNGYKRYKTLLAELPLDIAVEELKSIDNYTHFSKIPTMYINGVVSAEDRRFYYHNGFDFVGTLRAVIVDIKAKSLEEGGSTITQQLAKNMYFGQDNSPIRKMAEIFMAMHIEKEYSKNEIIEMYANVIYFGSGYYNIYDASMGYFGKEPSELNDYEATLLAGIPNAPSVYSPKVNPELSEKRQEKILECLVRDKHITQEEADEIMEIDYKP